MTEPADLAHDVLIRAAEFIRRLPADQLADLASGEAKLELVPKGGRRVPATRTARAGGAALPRPSAEILDTMKAIGDRAAARRYLAVDLKLTVAQLRQLAAEFGVTVGSKDKKDEVVFNIVEWAVGRGLDADVISRVGGAR